MVESSHNGMWTSLGEWAIAGTSNKVDTSHHHNVEQKKPDLKDDIVYDPFMWGSKVDRAALCAKAEYLPWGKQCGEKAWRGLPGFRVRGQGLLVMFCVPTWELLHGCFQLVRIYPAVHLRYVHFSECRLDFNKKLKKKKKLVLPNGLNSMNMQ